MKTYWKTLLIECDNYLDSKNYISHCHREIECVLSKGEPLSVGYKDAKDSGWQLGKRDLCPHCKEQNKKK